MVKPCLSVGIDIGTSTTQLILSRLTLANRANPSRCPASPSRIGRCSTAAGFTSHPALRHRDRRRGVRTIVAGVPQIRLCAGAGGHQGGGSSAGETARKGENAREVLSALSQFARDFVVATAGPDLESILAARGRARMNTPGEHHTGCITL